MTKYFPTHLVKKTRKLSPKLLTKIPRPAIDAAVPETLKHEDGVRTIPTERSPHVGEVGASFC
jgi:hypothetical protein